MAAVEKKPQSNSNNKKRKQRYLPHNKSVKKGSYPLHPGVQGFFLTCDGGRERQATHEAINVIDTFFEEIVNGDGLATNGVVPPKPMNKIIKFADSDSSSEDDGGDDSKSEPNVEVDATNGHQESEKDGTSPKKQRLEEAAPKPETTVSDKIEEQSIDRLIEAEINDLKDRSKRRFSSLDSGCNGCVFVKMHKKDGEPGPVEIVHHMMTSAASTRKHMSRFILRVLPVEVTCYASEEEISKSIQPLIAQYFPTGAETPLKFAVLYEARANTGIDRMKIINAVAKSVPEPHKVDLNSPDKTIVVQIAKTLCMIGVVEKYKELSKYNLRQLTAPKP